MNTKRVRFSDSMSGGWQLAGLSTARSLNRAGTPAEHQPTYRPNINDPADDKLILTSERLKIHS